MRRKLIKGFLLSTIFVSPTITVISCGQAQNPNCKLHSEAEFYHQYKMAMELIDKGQWKSVDHKLITIFNCNKKFAPAYAALAWARAHAYVANVDPKVKKTIWKEVKDFMKKSLKYAKNDSQKFIGHVTAIRIYTLTKVKDWLDEAEDHFEDATKLKHLDSRYLPYYKGKEAAYYYMGEAYFEAGLYDKAKEMLKHVLAMAPYNEYVQKAQKLLEKIQRIERVTARYSLGDLGKLLAKKDYITRAELAALLVDEINLPKLFLDKLGSNFKVDNPPVEPLDIRNNPYKEEILTVLKLGLRGLRLKYDPKAQAFVFEPNKPVTRCELAMILEDIYAKITKNPSIKRKYLTYTQAQDPFKDLPVTNGCFNAMMNAVNLGWLSTDNGYVHPNQPVTGAEAVEAVYKLRDMLYRTF